jgi:transcription initiation factor TFIIB
MMSYKNNSLEYRDPKQRLWQGFDDIDDLDNIDCGKFFEELSNNILSADQIAHLDDSELELSDINNNCDAKGRSLKSNKIEKECSNCNSCDFIEDSNLGILICECGQVFGSIFDQRNEVRTYDDDGKIDKTACMKVTNELLPQSSLGTRLPTNIKGTLQKLQNWGAMPYRERSLYNDFKKINERCVKLGLKKNIQDSSNIFYASAKSCKHAIGKNEGKYIITRGKNNRGIQAGCIWISCKKNNTPVTSKSIADIFELTIKELNKGIKSLIYLLNIKNITPTLDIMKSEHYIKKYCEELNLNTKLIDQSIMISKNIEKVNLASEHTQFSIAATSVLIMGELNGLTCITKKKIKQIFGVSEVTIGKTYKKLENIKHLLLDDVEINKIVTKINVEENNIQINNDVLKRMSMFGIDTESYIKYTNHELIQKSQNNTQEIEIKVKNRQDITERLKPKIIIKTTGNTERKSNNTHKFSSFD